MADFTGPQGPENPKLIALLRMYKEPKKRLAYLTMMEALLGVDPGTVIMSCPPDPTMNAKVAEVNLRIEGKIYSYKDYEKPDEESGLSRGALWAQIRRFYQLWAASVYVSRRTWGTLSKDEQNHLKSVLKEFFFRMETDSDVSVIRAQMQPSIEFLRRKRVARQGSADPAGQKYRDTDFPSGVPFSLPPKE
jgi:hypothetical protein